MPQLRCPNCSATALGDATWCTLCFADLTGGPADLHLDVDLPTDVAPLQPLKMELTSYGTLDSLRSDQGGASVAPERGAAIEMGSVLSPLDLIAPIISSSAAAPSANASSSAAPAVDLDEAGRTWPCTSCQSPVPVAASVCPVCRRPVLAALAAEGSGVEIRLPLLGDLLGMSRRGRLAVAAGLAILLSLIGAGLIWLVGSLL